MKKRLKIPIISLIVIFTFLFSYAEGQENLRKIDRPDKKDEARVALNEIEKGISNGNVQALIDYFGSQTYLSLSNGINGYYSSNQAYYVLEDFFGNYRASDFKFNDMQIDKGNMYGTGTYTFSLRGNKTEAHVYISLKHIGKKWKITQLTIN